jgi:imidazolonepropionase-like amidohydrolase
MEHVHGETVYTGRKVLEDACVVFNGQRIVSVGRTRKGDDRGSFRVITPAFIDAHSHIAMVRAGEPAAEAEANDQMDPILAVPDALDSVQMDDESLRDATEMGVLYSCVLPGSGNIIGGLSAVIRHYAATTTDALVARAGVKAAFGYNPMSTREWKGRRPTTRMGALAILRSKLHDVRTKVASHRRAKGDKKLDIVFAAEELVLRDVLARKHTLRAHVHKIDDIAALLRIADEFKLRVTVEHAGDVHSPGIFRELKKRGIPVVYGPTDSIPYKVELKHDTWRNVGHLLESGVEYGLMTDHPVNLARLLLIQTRWFTRLGLSKQDAIELVSRKNATILGVDDRLGTLEKGKWASFSCWSGDPFDITHYPLAVYGEGELLYSE